MGWNGSNSGSSPVGSGKVGRSVPERRKVGGDVSAPRLAKGIIAGLIVVVGAGLAAWWIGRPGSTAPTKAKKAATKQIAEVEPQIVTQAVEEVKAAEAHTAKPAKEDTWLGVKVDHRVVVTNGTSVVETIYTEDGKSHKVFSDTTPRVVVHVSDQILALATQEAPDGTMPPLPGVGPNFENEFAESLKTEIVINDDDSEDVKEVKQRVKQAREDMLAAMSEGMSAQEVLTEHRKMLEDNAATRMEVVDGLKEYLEKGDLDGAQEYCDKMNPALDEMGIMRIELPRSQEEIRAERLQRRAEMQQKETK